jgi:hypothetical protein
MHARANKCALKKRANKCVDVISHEKRLQLKNKKINRKLKLNFDCIMDFL